MNSPYSGTQFPAGYQVLWTQYSKYIVYGAKITLTFFNPDPTGNVTVYCFPWDENNGSVTTTYNSLTQIATIPFVRYKTLGPANAGSSVKTIKMYMSCHKFFGIDWGIDKGASQTSTSNTAYTSADQYRPSNIFKFYWGYVNPAHTTSSAEPPVAPAVSPPRFTLRMTYYSKWFGRRVQFEYTGV